MLLFVRYKLLPDADEQEFVDFSAKTDLGTTRSIPGVQYFNVSRTPDRPREFREVIQLDRTVVPSQEAWIEHVGKYQPKHSQERFASLVDEDTIEIETYEETTEGASA